MVVDELAVDEKQVDELEVDETGTPPMERLLEMCHFLDSEMCPHI